MTERVRLDKWLWAARFFKTRSLATEACQAGRIKLNGSVVKPAHDVRCGDWLLVRSPGGEFELQVLGVSDVRGPAPVAQALYAETEASRKTREREAEQHKLAPEPSVQLHGRPTKRDRRDMERWRG
ncbi:RNA-binding S4 domain-containing protein [Derxia lacustris]|uniref:RNA-binding S4 domain-containing protein n=1 Tax=Derxia lacustris TaxID=764842 RepID=UPI001F2594D6|nr:RNA-binding S4 domain-containing protein [Derxia lacustris]